MIFLLFLLISVEEDREIPIVLPDYTDSLPVLYPYHSTKTKFSFTYGYPDMLSGGFENNYIKILLEKGQDIDKYVKYISNTQFNTHLFNFRFCQPIELRNNTFLSKPLLALSIKWKNIKVHINESPNMEIYKNTTFTYNNLMSLQPSMFTGNGWDTLSVEYMGNNFLLKPFISPPKKGGVIIQYHNENKGIRIKLENAFSSRNLGDVKIGEIGYFSPLFYIRTGRDNKVYLDTLVYMPFIFPNFSYIIQNYVEAGLLFMKVKFGTFNSSHFHNYDALTPEFYNEPILGISFSIDRGDNNLGIFLGKKDTINIGGLKFNAKRNIHIFRLFISGYAGYFSDVGYYGVTNISIMLKKRFLPMLEIKNVHIGKMMGGKFLPISIYAGIRYESIQ